MFRFLARAVVSRSLAEPVPPLKAEDVDALARRLQEVARERLGRGLTIRAADAGSCNGCELEIHALGNVYYDLERFGLRFTASPRHADVLLVTGPVTVNMREALERTWAATPDPKWVVVAGACGLDGGLFQSGHGVVGGVGVVIPVDLFIPGCPPSPTRLLQGLLALLEVADCAAPAGHATAS